MKEPFLLPLPMGDDLLDALTRAFRDRSIRKAAFNVIGAVSHAVLGYYDPNIRQYENKDFRGAVEIVSCMGNVSEKDHEIFVHAHITLADENYRCVGGHLMPGTEIFAAELYATPLVGKIPVREFDQPTGLTLWADFSDE